jgi:uridine kinase
VTEGDDIAEIVLGRFAHVPAHRPLRVGIDGRSAAGKTTFADQLAEAAGRRDRSVVRASVDDFHPPGHKSRGYTLETYYGSAFDYRRFRSWVLDPLEPGGGRRCRLAYWDSFTDTPASPELTSVAEEAVLIVDGALLLRPELRECWDVVVWLHISFDEMVARAVKRDVAWAGDPELVRHHRYTDHWTKAHELYERRTGGQDRADLVVDNSAPLRPRVLRAAQWLT